MPIYNFKIEEIKKQLSKPDGHIYLNLNVPSKLKRPGRGPLFFNKRFNRPQL